LIMKLSKTFLPLVISAVITSGALVGCSGGGTGTAGNSGPKVTSGVITGFGSVFVNGVEYQSTNSTVKVNGVDGTENDLALGMVVKVKGSVNSDGVTGTATDIEFNDETEGTLMAINLTSGVGTINVMGQTVNVDASTVFKSDVASITTIDMMQVGNIVEVSGYSNGTGTIYATRIEVKKMAHTAGEVIEVKGKINSLDTTAMTFILGDPTGSYITVDYSNANLTNFPTSGIADGQFVEVASTSDVSGNTLAATKVEMQNADNKHVDANMGDDLQLEGVVTADLANNQFMLNDQTVVVDPTMTEVENGALTDIVMGAKLEVEGQLDADGNLVASDISFREQASAEMFAQIDAVSPDTNTVTVMGVDIQVNTLTHMADAQDANNMTPVRYFSLADVAAGDWIDVHYYQDSSSGNYVATELKRENAPTTATDTLSGTIDSLTDSGLLIVSGVTVDPTSVQATPALTVGMSVEITGSYSSGTLVASSIVANN